MFSFQDSDLYKTSVQLVSLTYQLPDVPEAYANAVERVRYLAQGVSIDLAVAEYTDAREGVIEVAVLLDNLLACGVVTAAAHEAAMAILRRLIAAPQLRKPRIGAGRAV